ncbi:uncharacterized protein [Watersipora subatra]|uniref:uncharacterized protein n=1 Tax=Watersipora subatra TaxID=2589382 RepID=UPI00355C1226
MLLAYAVIYSTKPNRVMQEKKDVSEFTIPEIARCQLNYPSTLPSTLTKEALWQETNERQQARKTLIRQVPALLKLSCKELISTLSEGRSDQLDMVTAIYTFISSVDIAQLQVTKEELLPNSPLEYFLQIKDFKANHAHLFCALCKVAGIPCAIISGHNKSSSYQLGKPLDLERTAAQWNAVFVKGEWRLVDCFWSSCCVTGSEYEEAWQVVDINGRVLADQRVAGCNQLTHRINQFFFLTDPEKFLATHFPKQTKWQLLPKDRLLSQQQFEEAVYKRERFFDLGLEITIEELKRCRLSVADGMVRVNLRVADDSASKDFKYILYRGAGGERTNLNRYVMFQRSEGNIDYNLCLPQAGEYKLDIYGKDSRQHNSLDLACSYLIVCSSGTTDQALPDNPEIGWGPHTGCLSAFGIQAISHKATVIETDTGVLDIVFDVQGPLELQALLLSNHHSKELLSKHAYVEATEGQCIVHIRLPEKGIYACKLYANEQGLPAPFQNVCNYLIKCTKKVTNEPYPYIRGGKSGASYQAAELKVVLEPKCSEVNTTDGKFRVSVSAPEGVVLYAVLHHNRQTLEQTNQQVEVKREGTTVTFDLMLRQFGLHCLSIYALENNASQLCHLYNYVIDNKAVSTKQSKQVLLLEAEQLSLKKGRVEVNVPCTDNRKVLPHISKEVACMGMESGVESVTRTDGECILKVRLKDKGVYNLDVYVAEPDGDSTLRVIKRCQLEFKDEPESVKSQKKDSDNTSPSKDNKALSPKKTSSSKKTSSPKKPSPSKTTSNPPDMTAELLENEKRQKLDLALESKDIDAIKKAMEELTALENLSPKSTALLQTAENYLEVEGARRGLLLAVDEASEDSLEKAIEEAESVKHNSKLGEVIKQARQTLQKLRVSNLKATVLNLDQTVIAELKSFATPPKPVETTMRATLMLLGSKKKEMREWKKIVAFMSKTGKESLKRRIIDFKLVNLRDEVAEKSAKMLYKFSHDEAREASTGAAAFYIWAGGMLDTFKEMQEKGM